MTIASRYFSEDLFLSELWFQCALFSHSISRLERAAEHWIKIGQGIDDGETASPLEIVADCTVSLSAMAAIRRVISPHAKAKSAIQHRSKRLMELLDQPELPCVTSAVVRNAWEHFDERLDEYLAKTSPGKRFVTELQVSSQINNSDATVMRRFDPQELAITFRTQSILLRPCAEEIKSLSKAIAMAYLQLHKQSAS